MIVVVVLSLCYCINVYYLNVPVYITITSDDSDGRSWTFNMSWRCCVPCTARQRRGHQGAIDLRDSSYVVSV